MRSSGEPFEGYGEGWGTTRGRVQGLDPRILLGLGDTKARQIHHSRWFSPLHLLDRKRSTPALRDPAKSAMSDLYPGAQYLPGIST